MKKYFFIFIFFYCLKYTTLSQFPTIVVVKSNGEISTSPPTEPNKIYRIVITGTFSIWPQFSDCHGLDAGYVYDVPKEEINALRWPPEEIEIFGQKIEVFKLPKWVGDTTLYQFPPPAISKPIIELSLRKQKGLRINGEPIPNLGFDSVSHKYEIELQGTGKPFEFQIIDTNYVLPWGTSVPRYEDNCGELNITIYEKNRNDSVLVLNKCYETFVGEKLLIGLNLHFKDSTFRKNILNKAKDIILSFGDNSFKASQIECRKQKISSNFFFLLDASGSMLAGETSEDTIQRIDVAKSLLLNICEILDKNDKLAFVSCNEKKQYLLPLDYFTQVYKNTLINTLAQINAGFRTDLLSGINFLKDHINIDTSRPRFAILLTDFGDNVNQEFWDKLEEFVKQDTNLNILLINFGLGGNEIDTISKNKLLRFNAYNHCKVFNSKNIYDILENIKRRLFINRDDECCDVEFEIDSCFFKKDTLIIANLEIKFLDTSFIVNVPILFKCSIDKMFTNFACNPNRTLNSLIISFIETKNNNNYKIKIYNSLGNLVFENELSAQIGRNEFKLDISNFSNGLYLFVIYSNSQNYTFKFIKNW